MISLPQNIIAWLVFVNLLSTSLSLLINQKHGISHIRSNSMKLRALSNVYENMDALLFDCDGVIAETERDVHRITFNSAFKSKGLSNEWSIEQYGELLKIGGGKERMKKYFEDVGWPSNIETENRDNFIKDLHELKTNLFTDVINSGGVPLRPGVDRLIDEALANGLKVGVCSTSNEVAVKSICNKLLGDARLQNIQIFAGDIVEKKKPSPDVYLLASKTLNVDPSRCWVVEDSHIGLTAAKSAGMKCIVTKSFYTVDEDFSKADIIVENLDQGIDGKITVLYLNYKSKNLENKSMKSTPNTDLFSAGTNVADMFSKIAKGDLGKGMPF